ncbi:MAG TPA: hypothetical protein VE242_14520 [Chthoniobacterales bacterium]|nr:hypothetical protein [Chthoniobacterales bacterium]
MLRKTVIGVAFSIFIGVFAISLSDHSVPQLGLFRTALFKSQGLIFKAICCGSSNVADKFANVCWRYFPRSWSPIHGKIRIEILWPATCPRPSCSLSQAEPDTVAEDRQVRIVLDLS